MNAVVQTTPDMGGTITATAIAVWVLVVAIGTPIIITAWRRARSAARDTFGRLP